MTVSWNTRRGMLALCIFAMVLGVISLSITGDTTMLATSIGGAIGGTFVDVLHVNHDREIAEVTE